MAPFRLPFTSRKPVPSGGVDVVNNENVNPQIYGPLKPSLALGMKERRAEPNEFKLSSVADDGSYMPPSPTEKKSSFWSKSPTTTASSNHRSVFSDNDHFSISRESFDSYRRSFDISGRAPITHTDSYNSRTSLDSRSSRLPPRSSIACDTFAKPPVQEMEEPFEEIGLNDEVTTKPKKKGFLSRFQDSSTDDSHAGEPVAKTHHFSSILPGRRRGQSGTGSELAAVAKTDGKGKAEVVN